MSRHKRMFAFNGMREIVVHRIAGGCLFRTSSPQPDKVIIQKRTAAPSFMMSIENRIKQSKQGIAWKVQALGHLVSVSWTHYCAYTSDLSNS